MATVTVKRIGRKGSLPDSRYRLFHSALPDRSWVRGLQEMKHELMVACDLDSSDVRDMMLDAFATGEASREVG